jgi:hypothetical protein
MDAGPNCLRDKVISEVPLCDELSPDTQSVSVTAREVGGIVNVPLSPTPETGSLDTVGENVPNSSINKMAHSPSPDDAKLVGTSSCSYQDS